LFRLIFIDLQNVGVISAAPCRTTQLTTLVGRLSGIRTQSGQTKINQPEYEGSRSLHTRRNIRNFIIKI